MYTRKDNRPANLRFLGQEIFEGFRMGGFESPDEGGSSRF
jgi:hypothetical protein